MVDAIIGEAERGLKYEGDVDVEVEAEENSGGEEIEIAEAIDCDMSDSRREARFWLLEKVDPRCSSSHFLPTVPIHAETTGGEVAATARDPKPGMDDTGGNADPFMVALFALEASCFRSTEGDAE